MGKNVSNEELVRRFVDSKAIDFRAIGNLVNELGPELAASGMGHRMVIVGRPFIIACIMPAADTAELVGEIRAAEMAAAVMEG